MSKYTTHDNYEEGGEGIETPICHTSHHEMKREKKYMLHRETYDCFSFVSRPQ